MKKMYILEDNIIREHVGAEAVRDENTILISDGSTPMLASDLVKHICRIIEPTLYIITYRDDELVLATIDEKFALKEFNRLVNDFDGGESVYSFHQTQLRTENTNYDVCSIL